MSNNKGKSLSTKIATVSAVALIVVFTILILITTFFKAIDFTNSLGFLIGFYIISMIVLVTIIFNVSKRTLKPLQEIVVAAENLSKGNLNIKLENTSNDEIGQVSTSFNTTIINLKEIITDINYLLSEMADCNFTVTTKKEQSYVGEFSNVLKSVHRIKTNLSNTLSQIDEASFQVNLGAEQVSSASQALSQGAVEQANSIEELSTTISEIANHVKLNAQNAQEASIQSNEAGAGVLESNTQMTEMISAMNDITDKSNEIGKIIKTIEDIAFQTNILALNAAVEAARAGTAGKGFAVVADEVRNLATKSAEAAKNTTDLIEQTVSAVSHGSKIADDTAKSMLSVVEKASTVTSFIEKIAKASEDQSNSINQVTSGVEQISNVVQSNSATAQESAAASQELNAQADMLRSLVNKFNIDKGSQLNLSEPSAKNNSFDTKLENLKSDNINLEIEKDQKVLEIKEKKPIAPKPSNTKVEEKKSVSEKTKEQEKPSEKKPVINILPKEKEETFKPIIESPKFEAKEVKETKETTKVKEFKSEHTTVVPKAATPAGSAINDYSDKY